MMITTLSAAAAAHAQATKKEGMAINQQSTNVLRGYFAERRMEAVI